MAVLLGAFAAADAILCVVFAIHPGGREMSAGLVLIGMVAAGLTAWALATLGKVERTDEGWGAAFVSYALAYVALFFFLVALALNHQLS